MKKTISILLILTLLSSSLVLAQDVKVKFLPNDKLMYYFQTHVEEPVTILFTFNKEEKLAMRLDLLERRQLEMEELILLKKEKYLLKVEILRLKQLDKIDEATEKMNDESKKDLQSVLNIHVEKLKSLLEKANENSRIGLSNAIEKSSKVLDKLKEKITTKETTTEEDNSATRQMLVEGEI